MIYDIHTTNNEHPLPLDLRMLGIDHRQEPINRPRGLSLYQWFYCVKGKGEFISNQQRSVISEGQGLLIYPEVPHIYRGLTPDWTVHFIGFKGSLCSDLLQSLDMHDSGVYHFSSPDVFVRHIQELNRLRTTFSNTRGKELSTACYHFLLDLAETITRINPSELIPENELIQTIISFLEQNYACAFSLSELAEHVHRSKEYLCTVFKQVMGQTLIHYLQMLRISHARIFLLQYPEKKVQEIAQMCGFESPSYFGKIFKKEVGITPEMYRKSM